MKRILLPILFSAAMVSAQAQQLQKPETMKFNGQNTFQKYDQRFDMQQAAPKANWKAAPRKAKSDGVYYTKPEQSLWFGSSVDGGYYYASLLMLAPYADVTFSGGDPMYQAEGFIELARAIRERTNKTIWCYTGFTYEALLKMPKQKELLELIDVLVDGPYVESLRDPDLLFRGSSNQRIISLPQPPFPSKLAYP